MEKGQKEVLKKDGRRIGWTGGEIKGGSVLRINFPPTTKDGVLRVKFNAGASDKIMRPLLGIMKSNARTVERNKTGFSIKPIDSHFLIIVIEHTRARPHLRRRNTLIIIYRPRSYASHVGYILSPHDYLHRPIEVTRSCIHFMSR